MTTAEKISEYLRDNGPATFYELMPLAGPETLSRHVLAMLADGKLQEVECHNCVRLELASGGQDDEREVRG